MLFLNNITKQYKGRQVINNLSLHIQEGDMTFIIGMSGAGKTTLTKLITREEKLDNGSIYIKDENSNNKINIESLKAHIYRRRLGVVFQDFKLLEDRTIFENIAYPLKVLGWSQDMIQERVFQTLEITGILHYKDKKPQELSGGEQQRVAIARAIANKPDILIADEPTGNLDAITTKKIMDTLKTINQTGTTVIMVTHDLKALANTAGRIIEMSNGRILKDVKIVENTQ